MSPYNEQECCPRFDPQLWERVTLTWENRRFVKDRVTSFLHIPLNYGAVMARNLARIQAVGALPEPPLILTDENSLWGADVYLAVTRDVAGAPMVTLSGTLLARVFEGPYRNVSCWIGEMRDYVRQEGKSVQKLYVFYTTCPKCAKKYGKNYVVLLAHI